MRILKKLAVVAAAVGTIGMAASAADARPWHRHHGYRSGWVGPAIVGGLALGALAAAPRYGYGYGYYDCRRRVVGYTAWGRPIIRRVCY